VRIQHRMLLMFIFLVVLTAGCSRAESTTISSSVTATESEQTENEDSTIQLKPPEDKWDGDNVLTFKELYENPEEKTFSKKTKALDGKTIEMDGFMAPPLSPEITFFVLTKYMMEQCPFCSAVAEWPDDIVLVYMPEGETLEVTNNPLRITGKLELGEKEDEQTGFVSLVRIYADQVEVLE
jgi:hypothetical protein